MQQVKHIIFVFWEFPGNFDKNIHVDKINESIHVTELGVKRTSSRPSSVLHYLEDKCQYFGLEILV